MPKVAILLAASPNKGFYSQISALNLACRKLAWGRWEWEICAAMGCRTPGVDEEDEFARWRMHLRDVTFTYVSEAKWEQKNNWVQVEAQLSMAPRDADVYLALDADTLPVSGLEDVLDEVVATQSISGVMAHYPPPTLADIEIVAEPRDADRRSVATFRVRLLLANQRYSGTSSEGAALLQRRGSIFP